MAFSTASDVNKRSLTLTINSIERAAELSTAKITSAETDADFVSFADAAAGGARDYVFVGTAKQNTGDASVWDLIFAHAGETKAVVYRPHGNAVPSVTQPHFTFSVVVKEPDGDYLGGDADPSTTAYQTVDFEWPLLAKPVKVTAP